MRRQRSLLLRGFTLIELLVVISIIAVLLGIALPSLSAVQRRSRQLGCESNLHQLGLGLSSYIQGFKNRCPVARAIPEPFKSTDSDPPLPETLRSYMVSNWPDGGADQQVYHCPGDRGFVYDRSKMSYQYETLLSGLSLDSFFPVKFFNVALSDVWVARDFDGATLELTTGGSIEVPFFHSTRRFLFADGHVGDFKD